MVKKAHRKNPLVRKYGPASAGSIVFDVVNTILLTFVSFLMAYPMYYIVVMSFSDGNDALKGGIWFWPRVFSLANYQQVFSNPDLLGAFGISVLRTVIGTLVSVVFIAMMAYALSFKDLPGRKFFNKFFFFTTIFSGGTIPMLCLLRDLDLLDNFLVYIIPAVYSFFNMILMRTAFESVPKELKEAAEVEGAGEFRIFWQIYLPLSKPVLATVALFTAVFHWNDWFAGRYYISSDSLKPASTLLQEMLAEALGNLSTNAANSATGGVISVTPETLQMAFVVITTLPIMLVYPFLQKYFAKGALVGSIKE
jgi:putative aldouronate transport system permease protein